MQDEKMYIRTRISLQEKELNDIVTSLSMLKNHYNEKKESDKEVDVDLLIKKCLKGLKRIDDTLKEQDTIH